jgi:arabinogalactan oligomer / maltooligosaccharide transport system permease protein
VARAVAGAAIERPRRPPRRRGMARQTAYAYAYIAPAFFFLAFATLVGVVYTTYISFTNADGLEHFDPSTWDRVGLRNYREVLFDVELSTFLQVFEWTIVFALFSVVVSFAIGLLLALLLNDKTIRERAVYRMLLIVPWALPGTIAILSWSGILNSDFGYLNNFLEAIGLPRVNWLNDAYWARFSVVMVNVWLTFPFMMTACLGALQSVPDELAESARIDGAGAVARFRYVSLPFLRSVVTPLLIGAFAYQFNNFNIIYLLTRGNPPSPTSDAGQTDILISYTYGLTITQQRFAIAASYAVLIFLIIGTISFVQMKMSRAFEEVH